MNVDKVEGNKEEDDQIPVDVNKTRAVESVNSMFVWVQAQTMHTRYATTTRSGSGSVVTMWARWK